MERWVIDETMQRRRKELETDLLRTGKSRKREKQQK